MRVVFVGKKRHRKGAGEGCECFRWIEAQLGLE